MLDSQDAPAGADPFSSAGTRRAGDPACEGTAGADGAHEPPIAPQARPSAGARLTSLFEVLICSGLPTQLLITVSLMAAGIGVYTEDGRLSLLHIVWLSSVDTILLVGLVLLFIRARGERPQAVFLGWRSPRREVLVGLLLVPVAFTLVLTVALAIEHVAPWLESPDGNPLLDLLRSPGDIATFALVAVVAGGFREELQRAFVLHRFDQHLGGAPLGIMVFSVAFGLGHALQGWDAAVLTGVLGALWGVTYLKRRSVVGPIVCHAVFNLIEVAAHGFTA